MKLFTKADVISELKGRIHSRTQSEVAKEIGISRQLLGFVLTGRQEPGTAILQYLKLEQVTLYRKVR